MPETLRNGGCMVRAFVLATAFAMLLAGAPASAQNPVPKESMDLCASVSGAASRAMRARQDGAKMSDMMESAKSMGEFEAAAQQLLIRVFETPRFRGKRAQDRAVVDFENEVYVECIKRSMSESP